jgi:hypothetical protein
MLQRVVKEVRQEDVCSVYPDADMFRVEHSFWFTASLHRAPANDPKISLWKVNLDGRYI